MKICTLSPPLRRYLFIIHFRFPSVSPQHWRPIWSHTQSRQRRGHQGRFCFNNLNVFCNSDFKIMQRLNAHFSLYNRANGVTPALATCQPRCECPETIPLSSSIIHMSDEELGCPRNYRQGIIAQWAKFQGNLQTA